MKIGSLIFSSKFYSKEDLKILFHSKLSKERLKFNSKDERLISQEIIPIKRLNPLTGRQKVVDIKVVNYVLTESGKVKIVYEGENSVKIEDMRYEKTKDKGEGGPDKSNIKKIDNYFDDLLHRESAITYICSNGETQDGLVARLTPTESFMHVIFHEQQHLIARNIEAFLNDEEIFLEYIRLFTRFDPATGKIYVAGGRAVTIKGRNRFKEMTHLHHQNLSPETLQY